MFRKDFDYFKISKALESTMGQLEMDSSDSEMAVNLLKEAESELQQALFSCCKLYNE